MVILASEQLPPHLAHPIGGPPLNAQEEIDSAHQLHEHREHPVISQYIGAPFFRFFDISSPISRATEWTAHFGQSMAHGLGKKNKWNFICIFIV